MKKGRKQKSLSEGEKTEGKKTKAEARSTNLFKLFFQHLPHGCIIFNELGEIKAVNFKASQWLGKNASNLIGQQLKTILDLTLSFDLTSLWNRNERPTWEIKIGPRTFRCYFLVLPESFSPAEKMAALFLADVTENKIQEKRIAEQLEQQKFLLRLASSLLVCPIEKIDEIISQSLESLGRYAQADRASLIFERGSGKFASMVAEWRIEGRPRLRDIFQNFDPTIFSHWSKIILEKKDIVRISSLSSLPPEAMTEKSFLEKAGIQSVLLVPIFQEQRPIGAVGVSSQKEREWSEETVNFLLLAADIFTSAFKRRQRGQTMATLVRIGEAAATAESLESLLPLIHNYINQLLPARNFYLALYDPQKQLVYFPYFVDEKDPKPEPRVLRQGITEYVLRTGRPLLATAKDINELAASGEIEVFGTIPFVWLGVPLKINGKTIGVLALQSYDRDITYTKEDEDLLQLISDNVALVINRKRNEDELAEKEEFLSNIFMSIQDGLCVLDQNFNIFSVNQAIEQRFNLALPLEGKKCYQALYKRAEPCEICPTRKVLETGIPSMEIIPFKEAENKEPSWLEVFAFPLVDRKSSLISGAIEYIRDITARRRTEDRLKESLREKDILLRELHHRVKNNMQVIYSLLNLQANHAGDPAAREMFRETQRRIRSMALVHEQLYQSPNLSQINFDSYLDHLSSHLFQSCGVSSQRVKFKRQSQNLFLDVNTAIPLGMIYNELLTNALKHAFPDDKEGEIKVILGRVGDDHAFLEVADNGVGLPQDFSLEDNRTLGLQIVQTLCQQIRAEIKIDRTQGTSFKIFFPCPKESRLL